MLYIKELKNGLIKITADNGVEDKRTNRIYSEVVCNKKDEKYFKEE